MMGSEVEIGFLFQVLLVGLIGWLFWEIKQHKSKDYVTREEIEHMIEEKVSPFAIDVDKLETKIDVMSEQIVQVGVTLARIDERMKRD